MSVIPVVHASGPTRAAIRRGLPRRGYRVLACRLLADARAVIERALVEAVVIDVRTTGSDGVAVLRSDFPGIPVLALSAFRPGDGPLLAECRRVGIGAVLVEGVDDAAFGDLILKRGTSARRRMALAPGPRLLRLTEPLQLRAWEEALVRAGLPTTTEVIARSLRTTREHLSREFAAGGAPNLKRVIDLCRIVWAADLLTNPGYTVAGVARILGFSSSSHLAAGARRVAGAAPSELKDLGPSRVLGRFLRGRTRSRL